MPWGSSNKRIFYYICPRIHGIKCKDRFNKQYIDNKGKCFSCNRSKITENKKSKQQNQL